MMRNRSMVVSINLLLLALMIIGCVPASEGSNLPPVETPDPDTRTVQMTPLPKSGDGDILFLRNGVLLAYDVATQTERFLADGVREFAPSSDGGRLALVRGAGLGSELWLMQRDGSGLTQLTRNQRVEMRPSWLRDGSGIVYSSAQSDSDRAALLTQTGWLHWCRSSDVRLFDIASGNETVFEPGCDAIVSPDGTRIAFATPPQYDTVGNDGATDTGNTIRLINRRGENGWTFASAGGTSRIDRGVLLYGPAWSPDSKWVAYQRFLGNETSTNNRVIEIGQAFEGDGTMIGSAQEWSSPPHFSPNGQHIVIVGDIGPQPYALSGYGTLTAQLLHHNGATHPDGQLPMAASATWSYDGHALAVLLPNGWESDATIGDERFQNTGAGDIWLWRVDEHPSQILVRGVDFASPLLWLAPMKSNSDGAIAPPLPPTQTDFPAPTVAMPDIVEPTSPPSIATPLPPTEPAATEPSPVIAPPTPIQQSLGSELLFVRQGVLIAHDMSSGEERTLADSVREVVAANDGTWLALVRTVNGIDDVWIIARDGSRLSQLTTSPEQESSLAWSPDGTMIVYASTDRTKNALDEYRLSPSWFTWAAWCAASEIRLFDVASGREYPFEPGCQPTFSPNGTRIAFVTPPSIADPVMQTDMPLFANTIRLVNTAGENGWGFVRGGSDQASRDTSQGYLVYGPTWMDNTRIAFHRFMGMQLEVDINLVEMGDTNNASKSLLGSGAGWLLPGHVNRDATRLLVIEHNYSDARGFRGYEQWTAHLWALDETGQVFLPSGTQTTAASPLQDPVARATAAAWSPDDDSLAVLLPTGWDESISPYQPVFQDRAPGEIWHWQPGQAPDRRIAEDVDFGSPLLWLPPY